MAPLLSRRLFAASQPGESATPASRVRQSAVPRYGPCMPRCAAAEASRECQPVVARRGGIAMLAASCMFRPSGALANVLQDYVERSQRPEMTPEQAVVMLLDARSVLKELEVGALLAQKLAATAPNSDERFRARALLPGMAKRLRQVGQAAPVVVAQTVGGNKKMTISKEYGGQGDDAAVAVPIYRAIGQVITISGRTIKKEAQASPDFAQHAIDKIDELLKLLPEDKLDAAQQLRKARQKGNLDIQSSDVPLSAVA